MSRNTPPNLVKHGFTLIELLVVIVIIGVLATLATVAVSSARTKARDARRVSDIKQIQTALELYMADYSEYPPATSVTAGLPLTSPDGSKTYMAKLPADPSASQSYKYLLPSSNKYELIYTLEKALSSSAPAGAYIASNQGNIAQGPSDGLIGWWRFDEGGGTVAYDSSSQGRDGTIYSATNQPKPTFIPRTTGTALEFINTGTTNYYYQYISNIDTGLATSSPYSFTDNTSFAIAIWAKYPRRMYGSYRYPISGYNNNTFGIFGRNSSSPYGKYGLGVIDYSATLPVVNESNQYYAFYIRGYINGGDAQYGVTSEQIDFNKWYHLVGVYDANIRKLYFYIDNVLKSSVTVASNFIMDSSNSQLLIGHPYAYIGGNADYYNGSLDDARIYNRALSADEVSALFEATKP